MMMTMMMMMTKVAELVSDENLMHVWEAASMRCLLCSAKSAQCSVLTVPLLATAPLMCLLCSAESASLILISAEPLCSLCLCSQLLSRVCSCYVPPLLSRPTQLEKKKATVESNLELPRHGFTK